MITHIDLNSDLGEGYGPWTMGQDDAILSLVTSANIACGGHAGDPETMFRTLQLAKENGVVAGAHPGYDDKPGFGRRIIPMHPDEIGRMVASQIGSLMGVASLAGCNLRYVKPHGALANLAADDADVARAILGAVRAVSADLAILAISGTVLEQLARDAGLRVFSEIFADRAYLPSGRLVPRGRPDALIHDPEVAATRLIGFLASGRMPVVGGEPIELAADSICLHGDSPDALAMARGLRQHLAMAGISLRPFLAD